MSTDSAALTALARITKTELRFFELVELKFSGQTTKRVFLCVGKHALYFVRRNLCSRFPSESGGEIYYAHVEQLVIDEDSTSDFVVVMKAGGHPAEWQADSLYVSSEHRSMLLDYIQVAWQTDHMWRFGRGKTLPLVYEQLNPRGRPQGVLQVLPWKGYKVINHNGYSLFVPDSFEQERVKGRPQEKETRGTISFVDEKRGMELNVHVLPVVPLRELEVDAGGNEHLRWLADQYKQATTSHVKSAITMRDSYYVKRSNLAHDIAQWTGWELSLKGSNVAIATVLMRRQYLPPLMDTAQDMSVSVLRKVTFEDDDYSREAEKQEELLQEARAAADSLAPLVRNCTQYQTLYREMIQAKLDALLFSGESMSWIKRMLGLRPAMEGKARVFLKSILKMLQDESALNNPDLMTDIDGGPIIVATVQDPMALAHEMMMQVPGVETTGPEDPALNSWQVRLARYLAYCVDGGMLGTAFTLEDLCSVGLVSESCLVTMTQIIQFLLHIRNKDMTRPYRMMSAYDLLHEPHYQDYAFSNIVMQVLLELGWLQQSLNAASPGHHHDSKAKPGHANIDMTVDYAQFLAQMLLIDAASANLKAAVCHDLLRSLSLGSKGGEQPMQVHFPVLLPALVEALRTGNVYLKTYTTATLVSMSAGLDLAKNTLMALGIAPICSEHLRWKDDGLIQYTLALLTNLTKSLHHRLTIKECGIVEGLMELMFLMHMTDKGLILAELASVIGQLCNDDDIWKVIQDPSYKVIERTVGIFHRAQTASKLRSKAMFALKQICSNPAATEHKREVSRQIMPTVVADLGRMATGGADVRLDLDNAANAILLLLCLSSVADIKMAICEQGLMDIIMKLMDTTMGTLDSTRERLLQLHDRLHEAQERAAMLVSR
eukprot:TRINITY_DN40770_c0_g1_i1.p1 TRINITY_DN40770_c0_g1~~TRINITY_DN40770_c0_g1_i1.p1  ORF type:complete len:887 (-),score=230.98 TRINITY_DN40770_c0_g1_i1:103-2763(-)